MQHHRKVPQAKIPVFVFLCSFFACSVPESMPSFLLIDPIYSKQIQIVGTCYHILYQKWSCIFCDIYPANVSVVNSSMMHFERGKKHTSYFLQPFCCCFHAQGTTLESGSSFFVSFQNIAEQFPCSKKLEEFRRLRYFMKKKINWRLAADVMPCSCSIPPIFWGNLPETNQLVSSENMPQSAPRKRSIFQAIGIWAKNVYTPKNLHKPQKIAGVRSMTIPFRLRKTVPFQKTFVDFSAGWFGIASGKATPQYPPTTLLGITLISSCQMVVGRVHSSHLKKNKKRKSNCIISPKRSQQTITVPKNRWKHQLLGGSSQLVSG